MSSEIYELMKRSDEGAVVEKAHRRPRFVEDCVREMVRGVVERLDFLTDQHFVSARQENLETIHQHNVQAERFGLLGEVRAGDRDRRALRRTTCRCVSGSTARTDLVGTDLSLETATWDVDGRGRRRARASSGGCTSATRPTSSTRCRWRSSVDGVRVAPRVLAHRWDPDFTETVYALTDALRVTERKGVRGDVLCADWRFDGDGARARAPRRAPARARDDDLALRGARRGGRGPRLATARRAAALRAGRRGAGRRSRTRGRSRTGSRRHAPRLHTELARAGRGLRLPLVRRLPQPAPAGALVQGPPDARRAVLRGPGLELVHGADRALVPAAAARGALDALAARRPGHAERLDGQRAARCAPTPPTRSRRRSSSPSTTRSSSARRATPRSPTCSARAAARGSPAAGCTRSRSRSARG